MKRINTILIAVLPALLAGCGPESGPLREGNRDWTLNVKIQNVQGMPSADTKVSYSGIYGEHTEFETGDVLGLFVFDEGDNVQAANIKVYCSGFDNDGNSVWSIFKDGVSQGNSSNYPLSDILGKGTHYFAYFPYNESFGSVTSVENVKSYVENFCNSLPSDQSDAFTENDLLVASNIPGYEFGEVLISGKDVSLTLAHALAMFRFCIPEGSVKYEYFFDGSDFTPCFMGTESGQDEYRYLFKAGCVLDFCVKYVHDGKLYRFETGNTKNLWPVTTLAGHSYFIDEAAPKVPYSIAVDMGTSVMWSSFNLGAEKDPSATVDNIASLPGDWFMWGVNVVTNTVGNGAYTTYNNNFTSGTKPKELPLGYDYTGDVLYDAARNIWGGEWRTPTLNEWNELYSACDYEVYGLSIIFTSKTTGNSITLPYLGYNNGSGSQTSIGYYWSSTSSSSNIAKANSTSLNASNIKPSINVNADRYTGLPIRPVYTK
ncbi:MAG: hypothetical protein ACI3ZL_00880 [Candidatus Cryptobacteroides sp.]